MERGKLTKLEPAEFLQLATDCGLVLGEVDLAQMARRKLILPLQSEDAESFYTELHLYVAAQYLRAVRPMRHPWATKGADVSLDEVSALAGEARRLVEIALSGGSDEPSSEDKAFIMGVERFLARIDPFGPLAGLFDLLQDEVVADIRNQGRLYLEVKLAVRELTALLEGASVESEASDPKTKQMFTVEPPEPTSADEIRSTQVIDSQKSDTSPEARDAIDSVVSAASEPSDEGSEDKPEPTELADDEVDNASFQHAAEATQIIEVESADEGLGEETSEPIVLLEDDVEEEPDEGAESSAADELDERLEKFRKTEQDEDSPTSEPKPTGDGPPPSPVERIAELNRRRQVYMKEQSWDELVALYEDGIGLFTDPAERQQIFLALAMLYEVKLREKQKAFDAFARAWSEGETAKSRKKAFQGLQRLGKESGLHERYMAWLQEQLEGPLEHDVEVRLQKELALGLFANESYGRAFESYAKFLVEAPDRNLTAERLGQLERFGEHVEGDTVQEFFETLQTQELSAKTQELVREFQTTAQASSMADNG